MPRSKPTPPTEPKQGSEERIEPVTELEAEKHTNKILRAMLAEAEAERDKCYERIEEQADERDALRAELAAKDAEVASLKAEIPARMLRFPQRRLGYRILSLEHELAAEKAAHEKSEARVRELESELSRAVEEIEALIKGGNMGLMNLLATRKKEESRG